MLLLFYETASATYSLSAGSGAFVLTGSSAALTWRRALPAASGVFRFTGAAAALKHVTYGPIVVVIDPPDVPLINVLTSVGPVTGVA
jgi:hypothetical protein